jgi:hypothetical protein
LASPCVPSPVSAIRTPKLPLLPLWEKGAGGMRGKGARERRTSLISPKNSTLERGGPGLIQPAGLARPQPGLQPAGGEEGTLQKSSQGFNVPENCYNPTCASYRRAKAPGYARRSPPARAIPDKTSSVLIRRIRADPSDPCRSVFSSRFRGTARLRITRTPAATLSAIGYRLSPMISPRLARAKPAARARADLQHFLELHSEVTGAVKRLPGQAIERDASPPGLAFTIPCRG